MRLRRFGIFALLAAACLGCSRQPRAVRLGDRVKIHYAAYADGRLYETSEDAAPTELVLGQGALPAAVEKALVGLRPGEQVSLDVPEAYGLRDPAKVEVLPLSSFGDMAKKLAVGQRVLGLKGREPAQATVVKLEGGRAWLDFNHRLAGKKVSFRLRLLAVAP